MLTAIVALATALETCEPGKDKELSVVSVELLVAVMLPAVVAAGTVPVTCDPGRLKAVSVVKVLLVVATSVVALDWEPDAAEAVTSPVNWLIAFTVTAPWALLTEVTPAAGVTSCHLPTEVE
jgi:hypothetical protein